MENRILVIEDDEAIAQTLKLKLEHTDVKIARGEWSNAGVRITPLNPTGKAWMIVARHVQNSPKPHANIKMDVHLSYTKASVETPHDQGVVAMVGVFMDTFIVLTMTALTVFLYYVILCFLTDDIGIISNVK